MDKDFIIKLYEEKDKIENKLHVEYVQGTYRYECWAQINLLDKIIKLAKEH